MMNGDTITNVLTMYVTKVELENEFFEGVVKQLNLILTGSSVHDVCEELEHALNKHYNSAIDNIKTPFIDLISEPNEFFSYKNDLHPDFHFGLNLSKPVEYALRSSLRYSGDMYVSIHLIGDCT